MSNEKIYISDIITDDLINSFKQGEKYLIESQTGSGKSYMIQNNLYNYAVKNNKRILLLSNRVILRDQNKVDLGEEKLRVITPINYQYFEKRVYEDQISLDELYFGYDYIVMDEVHYIFADASFSRKTDLLIETIINPPKDKVLILISATPQILKRFNKIKKENIHTVQYDYSYIKNLYFYNKRTAPEGIIKTLPDNQKVIYFSDAKSAQELANKFENAEFICSRSNQHYYTPKMDKIYLEIVKNSQFRENILCATKVLDNGINIKDSSVTTIIIDEMEIITLIQELGRKRILDSNDNINLYIRNQNNGFIRNELRLINAQLKHLSDFENMELIDFIKKYKKMDYSSVIDHDMQVNIAVKQRLLYLKEEYEQIIKHPDGYKLRIYELLGINHKGFRSVYNKLKKKQETRLIYNNGDDYTEKLLLINLMSKYRGLILDSDQQEKFKYEFFNVLFSSRKLSFKNRGILSINSILREENAAYTIHSFKKQANNTRKRYWKILPLD